MSLSSGELNRDYPDGKPLSEQPQWRQDFPTDIPEDDFVARREFTKFMVLTSGAFVVGQCWIGAMSLLHSDEVFPAQRIIAAKDIQEDGVVEFRYPTADDPCLLIRLKGGRLVAYGQKCTHLSCAVIPRPDRGELQCPCHHGFFEVQDGRPIAGPPRRPLPRIQLEVRAGIIWATGVELRTI